MDSMRQDGDRGFSMAEMREYLSGLPDRPPEEDGGRNDSVAGG
jgi:hypothetical protein